jgi:phasin
MTENRSTGKVTTPKSFSGEGSKSDRLITDGVEAVRDATQRSAAYTQDMYAKTKTAAEETHKVLEQTYSTVAKGAMDFNVQWIEMVRANTNSALDFARQLAGVKSPSEFLELTAAHGRKQFETFTEQTRHLTSLAQKVTNDAVQPLQAGVKSALSKAA